MAVDAEDPCPWARATADGSARRWRRGGLVALAALATASVVLASSILGHSGTRGSATEMMGVGAVDGASSYMLSSMAQQQQDETGQYYYPPGQRQPAMDFAEPVRELKGFLARQDFPDFFGRPPPIFIFFLCLVTKMVSKTACTC
jgi:hypothetical protein